MTEAMTSLANRDIEDTSLEQYHLHVTCWGIVFKARQYPLSHLTMPPMLGGGTALQGLLFAKRLVLGTWKKCLTHTPFNSVRQHGFVILRLARWHSLTHGIVPGAHSKAMYYSP